MSTTCMLQKWAQKYIETLQGVLGSGENGVKKYREQEAWDQKDQGAWSKGKQFREQGAEDSGHCFHNKAILHNRKIATALLSQLFP